MTNLAKRNVMENTIFYGSTNQLHCEENVIYGCFGTVKSEIRKENIRKMRNAQIKEGIVLGLKIFSCVFFGAVFAQEIFEWQNVRTAVLPTFAVVSMWAACAGSIFCILGLVRNLVCTALRK